MILFPIIMFAVDFSVLDHGALAPRQVGIGRSILPHLCVQQPR